MCIKLAERVKKRVCKICVSGICTRESNKEAEKRMCVCWIFNLLMYFNSLSMTMEGVKRRYHLMLTSTLAGGACSSYRASTFSVFLSLSLSDLCMS